MTFLTAELGTNWKGDFEILDRMVNRCKKAGVNAVKFQALSDDLINRHPEWDWYGNSSIQPGTHYGIEWFCTPCYPQAVDFLDVYVKRWKIRSADNTRMDIINKCINTRRPIILSTARKIESYNDDMIKQVYCIPKYPTTLGELNFDMLKILKGYSNHCLDVTALYRSYRYNIDYLEFHLTDSSDEFAIDNKVSLTYQQMEEFCQWRRMIDDPDMTATMMYQDKRVPFKI